MVLFRPKGIQRTDDLITLPMQSAIKELGVLCMEAKVSEINTGTKGSKLARRRYEFVRQRQDEAIRSTTEAFSVNPECSVSSNVV